MLPAGVSDKHVLADSEGRKSMDSRGVYEKRERGHLYLGWKYETHLTSPMYISPKKWQAYLGVAGSDHSADMLAKDVLPPPVDLLTLLARQDEFSLSHPTVADIAGFCSDSLCSNYWHS